MPLLEFPFFRWLRDLLGIRKDIVDTKKAKLEIQKLQDEALDRNLITKATIADIEKYDPKFARIKASAFSGTSDAAEKAADKNARERHWLLKPFWIFLGIFGLFGLIFALYNFLARLGGDKPDNNKSSK